MLVDRLLALLLLPLLTRAIGAADYGAWTQTLVVSGLLLPLVLFAFPTTIVRSFAPGSRARQRLAAFARLGAIVLALLAGAALLLWAGRAPVAGWVWGDASLAFLVPALLAVLAGDVLVEFANAWLRAAGRIDWISAGLVLRSALRYAVVCVLVAPGDVPLVRWLPVFAAVQLALGVALGALAVWMLRRAAAAAPVPAAVVPAAESLASMLRFLSAAGGAGAVRRAQREPRPLPARARPGAGRGRRVRRRGVALCGAGGHSVLGFTLFPVLSRAWHEGRRDEAQQLTRRALQLFAAAALPLAGASALAGPWLLPWLATAAYQPPWPVFLGQSLAVLLFGLYQILLYALLLDGRSGEVLAMAVAAAALNAGLNAVLIPGLGMSGAALAAALSNAALLAFAAPLAWRVLRGAPSR